MKSSISWVTLAYDLYCFHRSQVPQLDYSTSCYSNYVISRLLRTSTDGELVVWVGGLDSWDPLMEKILT